MQTCTVLGAGSFGTALAVQLAHRGHAVRLWDRNPDRCAHINAQHRNPRYLRDIDLPENLVAIPDLAQAVRGADLLVPVLPSHAMRAVAALAEPHLGADTLVCTGSKGLEQGTLETMAEVLIEALPGRPVTVISGPSFAAEMARNQPTTVVVAGEAEPARRAAEYFHGGALRVYESHDVVGVCLGASLKNVMAIGCGISDGLGMGLNARAAIITRGLAEITRLAVTMGADPLTMMGLAGMGDLVLTCTGELSRNRRVGLALGAGKSLQQALDELGQVAEGVKTAIVARELGAKIGVEMPITDQVYQVIHEGKSAREAMVDLMGRERKHELAGVDR